MSKTESMTVWYAAGQNGEKTVYHTDKLCPDLLKAKNRRESTREAQQGWRRECRRCHERRMQV